MPSALAVTFAGAGRPLALRRFPVPAPDSQEVLVRVIGCTLCGSDLHTFEGRRSAATPCILGHEILGRVEAVGSAPPSAMGRPLRLGERVTWSVAASCGACFYCGRRLPQKCERLVKYGHEPIRPGRELTGGLAEYCLLAPGTAIVPVPDRLTDETVCPANCATATIAAALRAAGPLSGQTVLVQGAGMLGLTACAMAREAGAGEVICCDPIVARLERAEAFGATRTALPQDLPAAVAEATGRYGVDVAFELSGTPEAFAAGFPLLRIGGTYVLVGAVFPRRSVSLEMETIVRRQLTLRGVHNYAPDDLVTALRFLTEAERYPFASLVADWVPLTDAARAFVMAHRPNVLRIGVRPQ